MATSLVLYPCLQGLERDKLVDLSPVACRSGPGLAGLRVSPRAESKSAANKIELGPSFWPMQCPPCGLHTKKGIKDKGPWQAWNLALLPRAQETRPAPSPFFRLVSTRSGTQKLAFCFLLHQFRGLGSWGMPNGR